jgi:hypothetical protein
LRNRSARTVCVRGSSRLPYRKGVPDGETMGYTRHRTLTTMRSYVRRAKLSRESPAGKLGLQDDARRQPRTYGPRKRSPIAHRIR